MKKVTRGTLTIRAVVAVYLLYLAYGLAGDYAASRNQIVTVIGIVVFVLCGGVILITSLRSLMRGEYSDKDEADQERQDMEEEGFRQEDQSKDAPEDEKDI